MNQFDEALNETIEVTCKTCKKKCIHNIVYVNDVVHHFRCSACGAAEVYSFKKREKGKNEFEQQDHAAMMERMPVESSSNYSAKLSFTNGQYLKHSKFGDGYVIALTSPPTKMSVLFEDRKRILLCGPGSTEGEKKVKAPKTPSQLERKEGTSAHSADSVSHEGDAVLPDHTGAT